MLAQFRVRWSIGAEYAQRSLEADGLHRMKITHTTGACFLLCFALARAAEHHFDASGGDDSAAGTSPDQAWSSLEKAAGISLKPGDSLLFKARERWSGRLRLKGGGTPKDPGR
jgi:hypothetical protein